MPSFGERLRSERETRGIRLSAVAKATKISESNLRALESDRFDKLPGSVFNRGFVRAYAEFIGLDPDAFVAAYESEERAQEQRRQEDLAARGAVAAPERIDADASAPAKTRASRPLLAAAVLALVCVVVLIAWLTRPETPPPGETSPATSPAPAPPQQPIPGERTETEPAAEETTEPERAPREAAEGQAPRSDRDVSGPQRAAAAEPSATETTEGEAARSARDEPARGRTVEAEPPAEEAAERETTAREPDERAPAPPAAEPRPEGSPEQPGASSVSPALSIPDHGVGARVVDRRLEGRATTFEVGDRVWFWTRVLGGRPGDRIRHVWLREGTPVSSVEIVIGGSHWRAYSWKTMYAGSAGLWTVEARDAEERVLATEVFTCVRPGD